MMNNAISGATRFATGLGGLAILAVAGMAPARAADSGPMMVAQSTYSGGTDYSQDSIMPNYGQILVNPYHEVEAAETNLQVSAGLMHTQYHENLPEGTGDDENGLTAGFGVGASVLLPERGLLNNADYYAALNYDFAAGNLNYGGHYLATGLPATATDRAVFNRIEGRLGIGLPQRDGVMAIPFLAFGYQAWNRNIETKGAIGTDEFYHAGLIGAGLKLDAPLTPTLVASVTGEVLALVGSGITLNNFGLSHAMGVTGEERVVLGLDQDVRGPFHITGTVYWEHFNYAGYKPNVNTGFLYEPLSTTTQYGADLGFAYSF